MEIFNDTAPSMGSELPHVARVQVGVCACMHSQRQDNLMAWVQTNMAFLMGSPPNPSLAPYWLTETSTV